jgi:hypothetical protein
VSSQDNLNNKGEEKMRNIHRAEEISLCSHRHDSTHYYHINDCLINKRSTKTIYYIRRKSRTPSSGQIEYDPWPDGSSGREQGDGINPHSTTDQGVGNY